jgi:thiol-disulfide isomerase/thioredoxin
VNKLIYLAAATSAWLLLGPASAPGADASKGSPAEQVAAIRAQLDSARADYVRKLQKAATTDERNQLMKEAPNPEPFAEQMLRVATENPFDPAALDALLWVISNGAKDSVRSTAKAMLVKDYADNEKLIALAVALSWPASAADEDALRQLLVRSKTDHVRGAATYALARQLISQAEMIDLHQLRLEAAATDEAKRQIRESLDQDFGLETANRLRNGKPKLLNDEAEQLLGNILTNKPYSMVGWPVDGKTVPLSELAQRNLDEVRNLIPGRPSPATEGVDIAGNKLSLADYQGKVVLLIFSGQWCTACRTLYPVERALSTKYANRPFTIFGINSDQRRDLVKRMVETEKMTWPIIWDEGSIHGPMATKWNVKGWPLVVLIDHQGVIRYKFPGAPEAAVLTSLVERLVSEAESSSESKK